MNKLNHSKKLIEHETVGFSRTSYAATVRNTIGEVHFKFDAASDGVSAIEVEKTCREK